MSRKQDLIDQDPINNLKKVSKAQLKKGQMVMLGLLEDYQRTGEQKFVDAMQTVVNDMDRPFAFNVSDGKEVRPYIIVPERLKKYGNKFLMERIFGDKPDAEPIRL